MTISEIEGKLAGRIPGILGARRHYAVLVPLVDRAGELCLLFETRAPGMRRQPGEVCFPGGQAEPGEQPLDCALRETWEELGIPAAAIHPMAPLDVIYHQSGFVLHPFLARVEPGPAMDLTLNPDEVGETFLVPLSFFRDNPPRVGAYTLQPKAEADFPYESAGVGADYDWKSGRVEVPIYRYKDRPIWGMTGRIIRHLIEEIE
ncbi:MAG: CoA pyrophosphatase [Pseudoflavonifractor sp.]